MDEIGHILREARENKGLTLEQVQEATRINSRFLNALELGEYGTLPTPVHVRGFLRNYARFLGLDPQPLLDRYQSVQGQALPPLAYHANGEVSPDNPLPERQDQVFFDPVNVEVEGGGGRGFAGSEGILQLVIIIALIIALALVANRFLPLLLGNGNNNNAVAEITDAVRDVVAQVDGSADATATAEAEAAASGDGENVIIEGALAADESGAFIANTSRNNPNAEPTITPTRPALPPALDEIRLMLEIFERTWIEVTIDGDVVFSGIARANDVFEWTAQQEAKVVTGNAIGVVVTINDIVLGRLGGRGERHEEVWRTTQQ